ncbi:uncharacterized protein [Haliotis asinina]|uniref:uncharacterized protein n=1 Tax=Haliotis asinina TaxID=109174 RepID=UPI0035327C06
MSSPTAFLIGVPLLVLLMPCAIHCSVTFQMYKRFVDSNCLSLGQIAQDICSNAEAACLPVFELVEYCEEFCGRHTMNNALLYSAIMAGNVPRLNSTKCRYCARDPMGLTCHILTFLNNAAECLGTTTTAPTTPLMCGSGGSPGTCVAGNCSIPLALGTCPAGEQCCLVPTTTAPSELKRVFLLL